MDIERIRLWLPQQDQIQCMYVQFSRMHCPFCKSHTLGWMLKIYSRILMRPLLFCNRLRIWTLLKLLKLIQWLKNSFLSRRNSLLYLRMTILNQTPSMEHGRMIDHHLPLKHTILHIHHQADSPPTGHHSKRKQGVKQVRHSVTVIWVTVLIVTALTEVAAVQQS